MGQHKTNINAIAKANGKLEPKKKEKALTKRDIEDIMFARLL